MTAQFKINPSRSFVREGFFVYITELRGKLIITGDDFVDNYSAPVSVWDAYSKGKNFKKLSGDITTDVLIVGAGIAGLLTAYFLTQRGVNCVVAEKGRICQGTTHNTTAKITSQHGLIYHELLSRRGKEYAEKYYKINQLSILEYKKLSEIYDCEFEIKDNYVYSLTDRGLLETEAKALDEIGADFEFCDNVQLPVDTVGAVKFPNQAQFNPLKMLALLSEKLNIYEDTFVTKIHKNIAEAPGGNIKADKIIVATHFPMVNIHGSYPLKLYQSRSYVIALSNAQRLNGMYMDESGYGLSFRNYNDYLLLGGGAHRTGIAGGNYQILRKFANKYYPYSTEEYHWSAQDCMSLDGVPYIGRYCALTPSLFVASGFNKWGMTSSMTSALILSDLVCDKENQYANVFNPSRSMLTPQLALNTGEAIKNLLTFSGKRCTHLGCSLKWNKLEHSWDCPCHGSRFDKNGTVLENPAKKDLDVG